MQKEYKRDKRSPKPKNQTVSRIMSRNKAKGTNPEILLRKALREAGLVGYRLNYKKAVGRPDIAYVSKKIAIFIHGCFWHRCPYCNLRLPKHNTEFWQKKFTANQERDERKMKQLKDQGWNVTIIWECRLKEHLPAQVKDIKQLLKNVNISK